MLKSILVAAIATVMIVPAASAYSVPAPSAAIQGPADTSVMQIRDDNHRKNSSRKQMRRGESARMINRHHHRDRYNAGGRYSRAPNGWHRYSARPGDWRTRGCILVGPLWFCP